MPGLVKFAAYVLVYFLIIYMTAIRRGGQPLLPWILLILVQAVSAFYFETIFLFIRQLPFFMQQTNRFCQIVTIVGLALLNFLLIILVNLLFERKNVISEEREFSVDVDEVPIMPLDFEKETKPLQNSGTEEFQVDIPLSPIGEPPDDLNIDDETVLEKIQELIDSGNREDAIRYLRMVVYFGKNVSIVEQAKQMLTEVQEQEET